MSNFWKNIKNIFKSAEESSASQPVIHKVIERTKAELLDYENWKETISKDRLLNWIREEHINYLLDPKSTDAAIDFLNTISSKGFVVHFYKTRYPSRDIIHLFDFIKEKILESGYKTYLSDTRSYNKKEWVEKLDRHYLKPPANKHDPRQEAFKQRFGNIAIELIFRNEKIYLLKFSATSYNDRFYEEAEDFNDLMKILYL